MRVLDSGEMLWVAVSGVYIWSVKTAVKKSLTGVAKLVRAITLE